jgi:glucose-6-phosphate 1-dehydrogenase
VVKLDPSTGIRFVVDGSSRRGRRPESITGDMEFTEEGGEAPTPYEVLLQAVMIGQATRFTRQDGVEETWRIMQPLLDAPPQMYPYSPDSRGPTAAEDLVGRLRRMVRAMDTAMGRLRASLTGSGITGESLIVLFGFLSAS